MRDNKLPTTYNEISLVWLFSSV